MNFERKHVFAVTLDQTKAECPELLMIALAKAAYDVAEPLCQDGEEFVCGVYRSADALSTEEASKYVFDGRRVQLPLFLRSRLNMGEIFASRLAPESAEIVIRSQEWDVERLMRRAEKHLDILAAQAKTIVEEVLVDVDLEDFFIEDDDAAVTQPRISIAG